MLSGMVVIMDTIGERLRYLREQLGVSQQKVSENTGISRGNLSNYEKNRVKPGSNTLAELAKFYNVSSDWILTGKTSTELNKANDLSSETYIDGTKMSSKDKKTLAKVIEGALGDVMLSNNNPNGELSDEDMAIVTNAIKYAFVIMKKDQQELKNKRKKDLNK